MTTNVHSWRTPWLAATFVVLLLGPSLRIAADETTSGLKPGGFTKLYNGHDLDGWEVQNGRLRAWKADGDLLSCVANGGGWLRTSKMYSDFVLRLDYRIPPGGNSGVGLRFPPKGDPAFEGMEIQILDDPAAEYAGILPSQHTGSIYHQSPAKLGAAKPAGEWNHYEITCQGPHVKIILNGQVVNDAIVDDFKKYDGKIKPLAERPEIGYVGLQSHGSRGEFQKIDFRNLELQDLTTATPAGVRYVDLKEGTGPTVPAGAIIEAHYTGRLANGKKFDSSRDRGAPAKMPLSGVIRGLQEGIAGMKVGGRRKLIIPPTLGYGAVGRPGEIPPDATLVYDIEITKLGS
jgi:hypothetical protein